jgi:NAD(P)-dependent dehydrogenase (short-subunit alcohol dehydrogenase family)
MKRTLVLGCARGIGAAGARLLAERGDALALGDIDLLALEQLVEELRAAGADAHAYFVDAADSAAVTNFVAAGAASLGGLDYVWSNVGVQIVGRAEEVSVEDLDRSFAINVRAHALVCGAAVPLLRAAGGGAILVTASNSALLSEPRMLPYATTKAAALALARQVARDYASDGIRVNALCPGWVDTPFNEPAWANFGGRERFLEAMPGLVPLGRISTPVEIARLACFLLSDETAYVTGHAFVADGGELLT